MKKLIAIILVLTSLFLVACNTPEEVSKQSEEKSSGSETLGVTEEPDDETEEEPTEEEKNAIRTVEDMVKIDDVVSVEKLSFSADINYAEAYKLIFKSGELNIAADIVLPKDYSQKGPKYPVLFYFPTVQALIENLATDYAANGICVVHIYERGFGDSEGARDFGGEDIADAQKLIEICDSTEFMKNSKMFVAGASSGSIIAMRLIAEDTERRLSGCAVVDVISDLKAYADFRGEQITNLFATAIGGAYDEIPEEYEKRSAVSFSEKLDRPMVIIHYDLSMFCQVEQTDRLYELVYRNNAACFYKKFDLLASDFTGEGLTLLVAFIEEFK